MKEKLENLVYWLDLIVTVILGTVMAISGGIMTYVWYIDGELWIAVPCLIATVLAPIMTVYIVKTEF